jgi:hypothetical protein
MRRLNFKLLETKSKPSSPIAEARASVMSHPWPWLAARPANWQRYAVYKVFDGPFVQKDPANDPTQSEDTLGVAGQRFILSPIRYILARLTRFRTRLR